MKNKQSGFSLVELMIVVAIIGVLASLAVPYYVRMQHKAKRAELGTNINGVKVSEIAYNASNDKYVTESTFRPRVTPTKEAAPWTSGTGFDTLGWSPDGAVRGVYKVESTSSTDFLVTGEIDVDGDSENSQYTATKSINPTMTTAVTVY